jgi:hypothetical protein
MLKKYYPTVVQSFIDMGLDKCKEELQKLKKDLRKYRGFNSVRQSQLIGCCKEAIQTLEH